MCDGLRVSSTPLGIKKKKNKKSTILNILTEYKSLQTNLEDLLSIHCWSVLNLINIVHSVAL